MVSTSYKPVLRLLSAFAMGLALASAAQACSVCVTGKEEARSAYYATTAILSFLPLMMIGGLILYLFKRNK